MSASNISPEGQATSRAVIAALPVEALTAGSLSNLAEDSRECCICLQDFQAGDRATRLPCMTHLYHTKCIRMWLRKSNKCPECKQDVG
ncbi:unnamed protein product [Pylaiella littoralis]